MENYKSLYRKWRPKTFSDVCGQEHITKTLQNQVQNQKISHAYLFCGTRGTGKTTCAQILAKAVNCENPVDGNPCNVCSSCVGIENGRVIDVIEMDAASNNSVDNIRDMREEVAFMPGESRKKVYIIDEVHMLTTGAFNALLKTLEDPPPHIIFILATTEFNKIPATILSRCQRHDFRRILPETIARRIKYVSDEENIAIEDEAINLIASLAAGAMRDALSILEVCAGNLDGKAVTVEYVSQVSGYFDREQMITLLGHIADKNPKGALKLFWEMYQNSLDCASFCVSLLEMFRNIQMVKMFDDPREYIELNKTQTEIIIQTAEKFSDSEILKNCELLNTTIININRYTTNKKIVIEMLLIEMCYEYTKISEVREVKSVKPENKGIVVENKSVGNVDNTPQKARIFDKYAEFIDEVAAENKMVAPFLRSGRCIIDDENKKITIYTDTGLKLEMLKKAENLEIIKNNLYKFVDSSFNIFVEAASKDKDNEAGENSIDDIIALTK